MELVDYLRILRKHWRSITALTFVSILVAAAFSLLTAPTYTATTSVFLSVKSVASTGELSQGSTFAENQVQSFARVSRTPIVLQPVIDGLGLDMTAEELAEQVTVTVPTNTATLDLSVVDGDPEEAARIAAAVGDSTVAVVQQLSPPAADGTDMVEATIIRPATVPLSPTTPKVKQNLALGLLLGLLLGAGQAILRDTLYTRIRNQRDLEHVTDRAILGSVVLDDTLDHRSLPGLVDGHSLAGESYRRLRTNLQFLGLGEGDRSIVVTSTVPGEGKTTTAINTAVTMAEAGLRVLLIDADLRRPRVADALRLEGAAGLTTVLIGRASLDDVVQPYGGSNLDVLTSGPVPPNPSEMLGFDEMRRLLEHATSRYDAVLIDTPPLLPVTDAAVLARITGGALVVVGSRVVRRSELAASLDSLDQVEARVLGLVLNKVKRDDEDRYGYAYRYEAHRVDGEPAPARLKPAARPLRGAARAS